MSTLDKSHYLHNRILHGDCLELMKDIPDGSIDMICCDLPYGVLHRDNPHAQWDNVIPFEPMWEQYERIIKENGAIILFAQGMFTAKLMLSNERLWRYNLIWDKCRVTGFLNARRMPMRCHEDICVFYKQLPTYNPQMEKCLPHQRNHSRGKLENEQTNRCYGMFGKAESIISDEKYPRSIVRTYGNDYQGRTYESVPRVESTVPEGYKMPTSIIAIKKEHESTVLHPTQKPVELLRWLIRTYTNEGEVVLDNCCGSGSLAMACIEEKRDFICMEKDQKWFEVAQKRIGDRLREPTLF